MGLELPECQRFPEQPRDQSNISWSLGVGNKSHESAVEEGS